MDTLEYVLSIIIPHYNSVSGVLRLLDSIPEDSRIQVIVADDRSTDDISELSDYMNRTGRELYMNDRPNKGAGTARNIGLSHALGKWLLFADSDDYFLDGWFDSVLEYADSDYDEIYFSPTSFNISTGGPGARHRHYEELVKNHIKKHTARTEIELRYGFYTPWSKLIRKSVFDENGILFDETMVANDVMAMNKCAANSKTIKADSRTIYCVTCGEKTLTSKKNEKNFDTRIDVKINRYVYLRERLSKKEFRWTHADYYMAGSLADAVLNKWGAKKTREILKKYRENKVKYLTWSMFDPSFLFHYIFLDFKWRMETSGR